MADILIRGIELPSKWCLRCPFNLYYANAVYCNCMIIKLLGKPSEAKYQNEVNCPLVELPEHGDLVDRDEYIAMMESNCDKSTTLDSYIFHVCRGGVKTMPVIVPSNKEETE